MQHGNLKIKLGQEPRSGLGQNNERRCVYPSIMSVVYVIHGHRDPDTWLRRS